MILIITNDLIEEILEKPKISIQTVHEKPTLVLLMVYMLLQVGSGGIVPIQIFSNFFNNDSPFILRLTGKSR